RLQPEQPAADHGAGPTARRPAPDRGEVVDRPVDEDPGRAGAGDGRDERARPGGEHARSERDPSTARERRLVHPGVEGDDTVAEDETDAGRVVEPVPTE